MKNNTQKLKELLTNELEEYVNQTASNVEIKHQIDMSNVLDFTSGEYFCDDVEALEDFIKGSAWEYDTATQKEFNSIMANCLKMVKDVERVLYGATV